MDHTVTVVVLPVILKYKYSDLGDIKLVLTPLIAMASIIYYAALFKASPRVYCLSHA